MEVRINSVLVVPPSVWGENLMWIAMSHCGAYEASDATVECVLCVCYNCFKSVDLFTQIVQGSFHTFICSLWTVLRGEAGEYKLIQELAPAEVLEVLGSRQSELFEWVRLRLDLWSFMTRCASDSSIPTADVETKKRKSNSDLRTTSENEMAFI